MLITSVALKNFRCFTTHEVMVTKPLVLIEGPNGSGKTSLLEALYYACHLRSFKTRSTRELLQFQTNAFSIKLQLESSDPKEAYQVTVGYSPAKRLIKINGSPVKSYKELVSIYRVIAMTDDDFLLIKGGPEVRRSFLDQAITLVNPDYPVLLRRYLSILEQRNALLTANRVTYDSYQLWTDQLVECTVLIREKRQELLANLENKVNHLIELYFGNRSGTPTDINLVYKPKEMPQATSASMLKLETTARRTLFGAHLDDYATLFSQKKSLNDHAQSSRFYASRGQQKLLSILLKIAQPATQNPQACVFLLDDIVSDLDKERLTRLFTLLTSYKTQIIMTCPLTHASLQEICNAYDYESISMPNQPD